MTTLKLVNKVPESTVPSAEFRLSKGQYLTARVGLHAGGEASMPTQGTGFTAVATTVMGGFTLTSNEVSFDSSSQVLVAQLLVEDGYYDFRLVALPGTQFSAIVCENTWRTPVQFTLKQQGTPLQALLVVDEHDNVAVSTMEQWDIYAIVNGITTSAVTFHDPNATVTLTANGEDNYVLTAELSAQEAQSMALKPLSQKPAAAEPARTQDASIEAQVLSVTSAA